MRNRARSPELPFPVPALLLAYALTTLSPLAAPETLVFVKAKTDTFYVHIDYDRDPDVAPDKPWENWNQIKVDSFYVTDSGTAAQARHVHYAHPFYAEVNGTKGSGSDYIWFVDGSSGLAPAKGVSDGDVVIALANPRPGNAGSPEALWIGTSGRTVLTVPEAATRLRLIDAAGRSAWEAAGLAPGARLSAPAALAPGVFRCLWLP